MKRLIIAIVAIAIAATAAVAAQQRGRAIFVNTSTKTVETVDMDTGVMTNIITTGISGKFVAAHGDGGFSVADLTTIEHYDRFGMLRAKTTGFKSITAIKAVYGVLIVTDAALDGLYGVNKDGTILWRSASTNWPRYNYGGPVCAGPEGMAFVVDSTQGNYLKIDVLTGRLLGYAASRLKGAIAVSYDRLSNRLALATSSYIQVWDLNVGYWSIVSNTGAGLVKSIAFDGNGVLWGLFNTLPATVGWIDQPYAQVRGRTPVAGATYMALDKTLGKAAHARKTAYSAYVTQGNAITAEVNVGIGAVAVDIDGYLECHVCSEDHGNPPVEAQDHVWCHQHNTWHTMDHSKVGSDVANNVIDGVTYDQGIAVDGTPEDTHEVIDTSKGFHDDNHDEDHSKAGKNGACQKK